MFISDYLFLDSLTINKLNYPSRSNTLDGASIPTKNNKYFDYYKISSKQKLKKIILKISYFLNTKKYLIEPLLIMWMKLVTIRAMKKFLCI